MRRYKSILSYHCDCTTEIFDDIPLQWARCMITQHKVVCDLSLGLPLWSLKLSYHKWAKLDRSQGLEMHEWYLIKSWTVGRPGNKAIITTQHSFSQKATGGSFIPRLCGGAGEWGYNTVTGEKNHFEIVCVWVTEVFSTKALGPSLYLLKELAVVSVCACWILTDNKPLKLWNWLTTATNPPFVSCLHQKYQSKLALTSARFTSRRLRVSRTPVT